MDKKQLGQFFTANSDYILQGMESLVHGKNITDPFAGGGDLIQWGKKHGAKNICGYDVDRKYVNNETIYYHDSINNPQTYKFVLTNPPYLHKNKASSEMKKKYFNDYFEDLYQISLSSILNSEEGIVIVPINFLSANNSGKIRNIFFSKFEIIRMNYFKQQVFPDTTYNVVAFYYRKKKNLSAGRFFINANIYPDGKVIKIELNKKFDWAIGGDFLNVIKNQKNDLGIHRLVESDAVALEGTEEVRAAYNHVKNLVTIKVDKETHRIIRNNLILLKAIDSGTEKGKISLENIRDYDAECLVSKGTSRHMIYLLFDKRVSLGEQKEIIELFNREINKMREKYLSLFLTNYRDNDRKRISFDFVYKFINHLYFNYINGGYVERQPSLF